MIGWYVHHQGLGHLTRLQAVAEHLGTPVTGISSLPAPDGWASEWLQLDRDDRMPADEVARADPTAGDVLHWVPRHDAGLARRAAALTEWVTRTRPSLVVVDVSVEVATLVRLCGVPVVVLAMPGERTDRPHVLAYDLADALLAPWPEAAHATGWPASWRDKLWAVGGISRFDDRVPARRRTSLGSSAGGIEALADGPEAGPEPEEASSRRVLVLWGGGGRSTSAVEVAAARAATPGWEWVERGPDSPSPDLWADLESADVVVTHGGQNAVAEVAAARRPAIVVAQPRPFDEQVATAAAVDRLGAAVGVPAWPLATAWPGLLEQALDRGGEGWRRWSTGNGAASAAARLDELAARHDRLHRLHRTGDDIRTAS
ncbi:glycosyltransferase [Terracoccus sp. 273MFTsu3.1]|uniref:glycosyltransferase n=1 Tax=Terracoccus sp. 273MFTsu3.1 TaxID=1172188 RepID=UPI0003607DAE|nr:glycosyltransferase [Terracoccus sp. 273MFTsu3.1]